MINDHNYARIIIAQQQTCVCVSLPMGILLGMGRPCIRPRATVSTSRQRAQMTAHSRATSTGEEEVVIGRQMARNGSSLVLGSRQQTTIIVLLHHDRRGGATVVKRPKPSNDAAQRRTPRSRKARRNRRPSEMGYVPRCR